MKPVLIGRQRMVPAKHKARARTQARSAVTLDDVAARAAVSRITASRALLSDPQSVKTATRARIESAAAALGYVPNLAASALRAHRSGLVIALVPTLATSTFAVALAALRERIAQHDLQLFMGDSGYGNESEAAVVRAALGRKPDAVVLFSTVHSPEAQALLAATDTIIVEAWDLGSSQGRFSVGFDNRAGGALAARHFLERGRKSLAFVANPAAPGTVGAQRIEQRWRGFCKPAAAALGVAPTRVTADAPLTFLGGRAALRALLTSHPETDAAFFAYDEWAAGAMFECVAAKIDVPRRFAICGFGGLPIASAMEPQLTTIAIPMQELGSAVASAVVGFLYGKPPPGIAVRLPLRLVVGGTT